MPCILSVFFNTVLLGFLFYIYMNSFFSTETLDEARLCFHCTTFPCLIVFFGCIVNNQIILVIAMILRKLYIKFSNG